MKYKLIIILFVLALFPLVLGESTFMDNQDDFFIMSDVVPTPIVIPPVSPGGGGGIFIPECVNDSGCDIGEFCFENKCYVYECDSDADCNDTKTCWMNRCVKLFDMVIEEVSSPISPGEFFNFTYYLKGVAAIHGDVIVKFWLVQNGTIVTEGFDTIYMADFEEKRDTSELFLPKVILPGVYNFYVEVAYDSYYARAGRIIEVQEPSEEELVTPVAPITGGVIAQIGEGVKSNVYYILIILGILILFIIIYWERRELEKALMLERRWLRRHKVSIGVFLFFVILAGIFYYATEAGLIGLSPLKMSFVKYLYLAGVLFVLIAILLRAIIGRIFVYFWDLLRSLFVRNHKHLPKESVKSRLKLARIQKLKYKKKTIRSSKKRTSSKSLVEKWEKKGHDTESLYEKPKKIGQGRMKAWLKKWKRKGYDTGSITESTLGEGSSQHSKNTERGYKRKNE